MDYNAAYIDNDPTESKCTIAQCKLHSNKAEELAFYNHAKPNTKASVHAVKFLHIRTYADI